MKKTHSVEEDLNLDILAVEKAAKKVLNPFYSKIFSLYYDKNLSLKEISVLIDKKYDVVHQAFSYAKLYVVLSANNPKWEGPKKYNRRDINLKDQTEIQQQNDRVIELYRIGTEPKLIAEEVGLSLRNVHNVVHNSKDKDAIMQERNKIIDAMREDFIRHTIALLSKYNNKTLIASKLDTTRENIHLKLKAVQNLLQEFKANISPEKHCENKPEVSLK